MTSDIILPRDFDVARLVFDKCKTLNTGGKAIYVSYAGRPCIMQTPEMKAPFGVSVWPGENGMPDKYSLDVSFDGLEQREPLRTFLAALSAIDRRMVIEAMENSQPWFKKRFPSVDVVNELYTTTVKVPKEKDTGEVSTRYQPTFKMSLPMKDGKFAFPVFGPDRSEIDLVEWVESGRSKGARVQAIVHLTSVWIVGTKFGLSWKVKQLKLSEQTRLSGYAFQKTEEDPPSDEECAAEPAAGAGAAAGAVASELAALKIKNENEGGELVQSSDDDAHPDL
jgi:hypothetical protein